MVRIYDLTSTIIARHSRSWSCQAG